MKHISNSADVIRTRAREIISFLGFMSAIAQKNAEIVYLSRDDEQRKYKIEKELINILKANLCLMLYNAMEGTFTQLTEDINDYIIENSEGNIDEFKTEVMNFIVGRFKESKEKPDYRTHFPIGKIIMQFWINEWTKDKSREPSQRKKYGSSGNIDGKILHENLMIRYGILPETCTKAPARFTHNSLQLNKNRRNELAHGEKSFVDMGREISIEQLQREAKEIFKTIRRIAKEIDSYLEAEGYLRTSSWQGFFDCASNRRP